MIPLFVSARLNVHYGIKNGPLTVPPVHRSEAPGDKPRDPPRPRKVKRYIREPYPFKAPKLGI